MVTGINISGHLGDIKMINKIEYAKKLIKFQKFPEAEQVLMEIINKNNDPNLQHTALEILLFDLELKHEDKNWPQIKELINIAKGINFPQEKLNKIEELCIQKIKNTNQNTIRNNTLFQELMDFFEWKFMRETNQEIDKSKFFLVDLDLAIKTMHDQNIEEPYFSWNDIREQENKKIYDFIFKKQIDISEFDKAFLS